MSRKLLALRHGEARNAPPGGDDADRPLTASGRRAAVTLGPVVRAVEVDRVLCSSALRARQTLEALELDPDVEVAIEPGLFGAEADDLLEQLQVLDAGSHNELDDELDDPTVVLLVGHNPGVHHLVLELTAGERMPSFRPATLAVLDLDVDRWSDVAAGCGRLASLHIPDEQAS